MAHRWTRGGLLGLALVALLAGFASSAAAGPAEPEEIDIAILITGGIAEEWRLQSYTSSHFTVHFKSGDQIILSANADGTGNIEVYPYLDIKVIQPSGSISGRVIPAGSRPPVELTAMFAPGKNEVFVSLSSAFPDLKPRARLTFNPATPKVGQKVTVEGEVLNTGTAAAEKFYVTFRYRETGKQTYTEFDSLYIAKLEPGVKQKVTSELGATELKKGKYDVCIELDLENFVRELDEANNGYCTQLEVTEATSASALQPLPLKSASASIASGRPALAPQAANFVRSSPLRLVRRTLTSASDLARMITRDTAELQGEAADFAASWDRTEIFRAFDQALRYATRSRRSELTKVLLVNLATQIRGMGLDRLIDLIQKGLPELQGELEALIALSPTVERPGQELLEEIESLYGLLCSLDPVASLSLALPDCTGLMPVTPVGRTWPQLAGELEKVAKLLDDARNLVPQATALSLIREARSLLSPLLEEVDRDWRVLDGRLAELRGGADLLLRTLGRSRAAAGEDRLLSIRLSPSPLWTAFSLEVTGAGDPVASVAFQLFALDGRLVLERSAEGNQLQFSPLDERGRPLANGVYLYVVTVRGWDGTTVKSKVQKLVVLR
jgi:hypothetical protein